MTLSLPWILSILLHYLSHDAQVNGSPYEGEYLFYKLTGNTLDLLSPTVTVKDLRDTGYLTLTPYTSKIIRSLSIEYSKIVF